MLSDENDMHQSCWDDYFAVMQVMITFINNDINNSNNHYASQMQIIL